MTQIKIPTQHEVALAKIFSLSNEAVASLILSLSESPVSLSTKSLVSKVKERVNHIVETDIDSLVTMITSLYLAQASMEISVTEFADSIIEALGESESKLVKVTADNREEFKERLKALLEISELRIRAKALEVLHEHEHALSKVRILTDVRPVFGKAPDDSPVAAVVVHTLKLTYLEGGRFRDFFVALDNNDLKLLKDALDRAEKKAQSLKSMLSSLPLSYIDSE